MNIKKTFSFIKTRRSQLLFDYTNEEKTYVFDRDAKNDSEDWAWVSQAFEDRNMLGANSYAKIDDRQKNTIQQNQNKIGGLMSQKSTYRVSLSI